MTAEPRCERTDLPTAMCAHCRGHEQAPAGSGFRRRGHAFAAAYRGTCEACDGEIQPGDDITRIADSDGYAHDSCVPVPTIGGSR